MIRKARLIYEHTGFTNYFSQSDASNIESWNFTESRTAWQRVVGNIHNGAEGLDVFTCSFCQYNFLINPIDKCKECIYRIAHGRCNDHGSDFRTLLPLAYSVNADVKAHELVDKKTFLTNERYKNLLEEVLSLTVIPTTKGDN